MSSETCPHCQKVIKHRKMCPVLRKQKQKEDDILYRQLHEEQRLEKERLKNEIEALSLQHPQVVEYIKNLEIENRQLQEENEQLDDEMRFARRGSFEEQYY